MTQGFVYFCGYDDVVKIGKSSDPTERINQHNVSNPKTVVEFCRIYSADMGALEKRLHRHFKAAKILHKTEWFVRTKEMTELFTFIKHLNRPSDFDVGMFLGAHSTAGGTSLVYEALLRTIESLKRRLSIHESRRRELWVLEGVIQSLKLRAYPIFQDRYADLKRQLEGVDEDDAPVFIWKSDGTLEVVGIQDYRIIVPIQATLDEDAA